LEGARLSDAAYAKVTRPFDEVNRKDGSLRAENAAANQDWLARTMRGLTGEVPKLRGFYRDKDGVFRVVGFDGS
jgi:hypothetical protein